MSYFLLPIRLTYLVVQKIAKIVLVAIAKYIVNRPNVQSTVNASHIEQALSEIPNPSSDCVFREIAFRVADRLCQETTDGTFSFPLPQKDCLNSVIHLAWCSATGEENSLTADNQLIRSMIPNRTSSRLITGCEEALELLTVMFMLAPNVLDELSTPTPSTDFSNFIIDLLLISPDE